MHLERDGYRATVAGSGHEGLRLAADFKPDAVLLDIRMPDMNGHQVCGHLRARTDAAVLFTTVVNDNRAVVQSLQLGADDYVTKPFYYPVLVARMEACLRRRALRRRRDRPAQRSVGPWSLDPDRREVIQGERRVQLTPTEYELLEFFLRHPDKVLAVDEILENVWGEEYVGDPDLVKQFVYRLRSKLESDRSDPRYFVTVRGSGYAFEPDTQPTATRRRPARAPHRRSPPGPSSGSPLTTSNRAAEGGKTQLSIRHRRTPTPQVVHRPRSRPSHAPGARHPTPSHRRTRLRGRRGRTTGLLAAGWRRWMTWGLLILLPLTVGALVGHTASAALPGEFFYPMKLSIESAHFSLLADQSTQLDLRITLLEERIGEIEQLAWSRSYAELPQATERLERDLDQAIETLYRLNKSEPAESEQARQIFDRSLAGGGQRLGSLEHGLPTEAHNDIAQAIDALNRTRADAAAHFASAASNLSASELKPSEQAASTRPESQAATIGPRGGTSIPKPWRSSASTQSAPIPFAVSESGAASAQASATSSPAQSLDLARPISTSPSPSDGEADGQGTTTEGSRRPVETKQDPSAPTEQARPTPLPSR